jgi:hypothetical protein
MKEINKLPAEYYLQLIRNNKPFSFSRFGDGEVLCMFPDKKIKKNTDGSYFDDDLIEPMKKIFHNQYDYYHCLLMCSFLVNKNEFTKFIDETCPNMQFYWGEFWQGLSFAGKILEVIECLNMHKLCFIGSKHLENIKYIRGISEFDFIEVPSVNAFKNFNEIVSSIKQKYKQGKRMFCFSAGYSTKIIIDTLFPVIGKDAFMIDFGSVFDPYCGKLSRSNMIRVGFEQFQKFTDFKLM